MKLSEQRETQNFKFGRLTGAVSVDALSAAGVTGDPSQN